MFRSTRDFSLSRQNQQKERDKCLNLHKCDICNEGWMSDTEVHIHKGQKHLMKITSMLQRHKKSSCQLCMTRHPEENMLEHIKTTHLLSSESARRIEREIYVCDYCSQIFFNKLYLILHMSYVHKRISQITREQILKCPRCFKLIRLSTAWCHFNAHGIYSVSVCPLCMVKCYNKQDLRRHLTSHPKHLTCDQCNHTVNELHSFNNHVDRHRNLTTTGHLAYKNVSRYFLPDKETVMWKYPKLKPFRGLDLSITNQIRICIMCREICTDDESAVQHILRHSIKLEEGAPVKSKTYKCDCGEEFTSNILLKHHTIKVNGHKQIFVENASEKEIDIRRLENDGDACLPNPFVTVEVTTEKEIEMREPENEGSPSLPSPFVTVEVASEKEIEIQEPENENDGASLPSPFVTVEMASEKEIEMCEPENEGGPSLPSPFVTVEVASEKEIEIQELENEDDGASLPSPFVRVEMASEKEIEMREPENEGGPSLPSL